MKLAKTIQKCQFSNKKDLKLIISLGYLPPVNEFRKINSIKSQSVFFPTDLLYSPSSKLVQLSTIVNKSIVFPKSYPYTSSTTKILRENFKELYTDCRKIINISKKDLVIDIGSNVVAFTRQVSLKHVDEAAQGSPFQPHCIVICAKSC